MKRSSRLKLPGAPWRPPNHGQATESAMLRDIGNGPFHMPFC